MTNEKKDFWELFFNWAPCVIAGAFFVVAIVTAIIYPVYSLGWKIFWMALGTAIFLLISIVFSPLLESAVWHIRSLGHYSEEITPLLLAFFFGFGVLLFSWINVGEAGSYVVAYDSEGRAKIISGSYFAIPYGKEFVHITSSRNHS